jgi:hypothetical protein
MKEAYFIMQQKINKLRYFIKSIAGNVRSKFIKIRFIIST